MDRCSQRPLQGCYEQLRVKVVPIWPLLIALISLLDGRFRHMAAGNGCKLAMVMAAVVVIATCISAIYAGHMLTLVYRPCEISIQAGPLDGCQDHSSRRDVS